MPVDDVVLATQGDTAAFERVYRAHMPRIFNLARRMAGPDAAEELTQDVFVRAWQKLALFRGESSFATWLHRLAVNVIIERFRTLGTARERFLADSEAVLDVAPAVRTKHMDLSMDLQAAIEQLPHGARHGVRAARRRGVPARRDWRHARRIAGHVEVATASRAANAARAAEQEEGRTEAGLSARQLNDMSEQRRFGESDHEPLRAGRHPGAGDRPVARRAAVARSVAGRGSAIAPSHQQPVAATRRSRSRSRCRSSPWPRRC